MKKFLLSMAMVLGLVSYASAGTISFTMDQVTLKTTGVTDNFGNPEIDGFTYDIIDAVVSKQSGSSVPSYNNSNTDLRVYANGTMTLTTTDGTNFENIVFTIPSSGNGQTRLAKITSSTGDVTLDNSAWTITWKGSASEVTFTVGAKADWGSETSKAGRFVISKMEVTTGGEGVERSAAPVISPQSTTFGEDGMLVTITAAEGASIYYTLDGTNPSENSDLYTAPIALTASATVKAIAVEEGKAASEVVEQTYTYRTGSFEMSSVLGSAKVGDTLSVGGIVTAICTRGIVVTDNSGSLFIYSSSFPYADYAIGDQVSFSGEVSEYGSGLQFDGTAVTIEKWDNVAYTYPAPTTIDWTTAIARTASEQAYYTTMTGTLSISGNYYNVDLGLENVQGSIYYATDEVKSKMANGQSVELKGYFISVSGGKYANLIVTEVVAEGDEIPATKVANIAEFIEKGLTDESTTFEITGEVAVTYQNGSNLYISDATGQILVYGTLENTYKNGDRLTGVQGSFKNYYSTYEMVAVSTSFGTATAGAAVEPTVTTIENIVPEIQNHYIKLENVTLDIENSKLIDAIDADIKYYNKFAIELPEAGTYDVIAVVNYYQAKGAEAPELQVYPIEFIDGVVTPPAEVTASTLAEALELGANGETGEIRFTGNVTVVYKNNRNIYVKDDTAWTLLYNKNDVEMPAYKNGDVITGFKATYALNDNHAQFIPVSDFAEATAGTAVKPITIISTGVADEFYHVYVSLTADFTATDEKNGIATDEAGTAAIYAQWNNDYSDPKVALASDGTYEILGFVGSYKGNYQILVTEFKETQSVEGIVLDNPIAISGNNIIAPAGAEIYSLNGVRVNGENLATGIYVVRVADKSFKVIVK